MKRSRPVSLALVGLFLWVTACTSYRQIEVGEVPRHGKVRVTLTDGERETLHDPWAEGDSILGYSKRGRPRQIDVRQSFAIDEVSEVESKGTDVAGTVTLIALGAGFVAALVAAASYEMCILSC